MLNDLLIHESYENLQTLYLLCMYINTYAIVLEILKLSTFSAPPTALQFGTMISDPFHTFP